ncbi:large ribosomal subunit protein bL17m-like isoform X2 [Babylonia areolata]|uniref:large ribosomal subunit protein bL17m-like isoform X2 n=1 Tax=Babylonia areolata TaxID=304850 RepID=UPI003FD677A5
MLRFRVRLRPRKLSKVEGLGAGPEGRLKRLRKHVTALIRHERVESSFAQCDEARGYAEKEKDLIHKLFKVLVPRYSSFPAAATSIHKISGLYPGDGVPMGVLELKGNPWPSVRPQPRDTSLLLHNILLQEARQDFHAEQQADTSSACPLSGQPSGLCPDGSSVDGPARPGETDPSDREKTPSYMQTKGGL